MIPSSLLGVIFFLFLLGPGLAFVVRRERLVPEARQSPFRETVRVVAASSVSLILTGLLFAFARWLFPRQTLNIRGLVREPAKFAAEHHVHLVWWTLGYFGAATLVAWLAADPRLPASRLIRTLSSSRLARLLVGPTPPIKRPSAWSLVFNMYAGEEDPGFVHVGAQLDDGAYVAGFLDHFNIETNETADRDLLLHGPLRLTTADGEAHELKASFTVVSARRIVRLDVSHPRYKEGYSQAIL